MRKSAVLFAVLLFVSSLSMAQVLVVNIWESMPGKGPLTQQYAQEASGIHQKLGASPMIAFDQMNRMHYVMPFESWSDYAKFQTKMQADKSWGDFWAKTSATPSATLVGNYRMDILAPGEIGAITEVYVWEAMPGRGNDLVEAGMGAKAIHEKAGAMVSINADQMNRIHYVMSWKSLEAWGKFRDTPNPEFQKFQQKFGENAPGKLVDQFTVTRAN